MAVRIVQKPMDTKTGDVVRAPKSVNITSRQKRHRHISDGGDAEANEIVTEGSMASTPKRKTARQASESKVAFEENVDSREKTTSDADATDGAKNNQAATRIMGEEPLAAIVEMRRLLSLNEQIEVHDEPRIDCHIAFRRRSPGALWMRVCVPLIVENDKRNGRGRPAKDLLYVIRFANAHGMSARLVPARDTQIRCIKRDLAKELQAAHPRIAPCTFAIIVRELVAMYDRVRDGTSDQLQLVDLQPEAIIPSPPDTRDESQQREGYSTNWNFQHIKHLDKFCVTLIDQLSRRTDVRIVKKGHPDFHFLIGPANDQRLLAVKLCEGMHRGCAFWRRADGVTYLFRGKLDRASGVHAVMRFVLGSKTIPNMACPGGDLPYAYQPFYPAIDGAGQRMCDKICEFALEQCRQPTRGFRAKTIEEWHGNIDYWNQSGPINMSEKKDGQLAVNNRIEIRSSRFFLSLVRELKAFMAREGSHFDIVMPLPENSPNAGKFLGLQLKATDRDWDTKEIPRLIFKNVGGKNSGGYPGMLMVFIALHRGLIWVKPYVDDKQCETFREADQVWRNSYVQGASLAEHLRKIVEKVGNNEYPELTAFTSEEVNKAPGELFEIEERQLSRFKKWSGLVVEQVASYQYDAIINGKYVQFKTTELKNRSCPELEYQQDDFDALIFVSDYCCLLIPSSVLAARGMVEDGRSIKSYLYVKYNESGCTGPDWLREYAVRFDEEGRNRVRKFFGLDCSNLPSLLPPVP